MFLLTVSSFMRGQLQALVLLLRKYFIIEMTSALVSDENQCWIVHEVHGKFLNFFRPSGREHQGLAVLSDLTDNFTDLRLETHVKHTVSFIQSQISGAMEICLSAGNSLQNMRIRIQ